MDSGIDRTLIAHVKNALNFTLALGLRHIFLATDNGSNIEAAMRLFPEYRWYTQQRPISKSAELYKMFTDPFELIKDDGTSVVINGHDTSFSAAEKSRGRAAVSGSFAASTYSVQVGRGSIVCKGCSSGAFKGCSGGMRER